MKTLFLLLMSLCFVWQFASAQAGTLDPTFGDGGMMTIDRVVTSTSSAITPDDKLIFVTSILGTGGTDIKISKYNTDGSLDEDFGTDGSMVFDLPMSYESSNCIAIQNDGKILVAGISSTSFYRMFIMRFNADGSIDSSFADGGKRIHTFYGFDHIATSINLYSGTGKILLSGYIGIGGSTPFYFMLNLDGSTDETFGVDGAVLFTDLGYSSALEDTKIQEDGKIVSVSRDEATNTVKVYRLESNGDRDMSFGVDGIVSKTYSNTVYCTELVIQPDNKILIGGILREGTGMSSTYKVLLLRYLESGILDVSFGTGGEVQYAELLRNEVRGLMLQPWDNEILVVGSKRPTASSKPRLLITRFQVNGSLDIEFGEPNTIYNLSNNERFLNVHTLSDGNILGLGYTTPDGGGDSVLLVRYHSCQNSITTQPNNISKTVGQNAIFVASSSSASATYQWQMQNTSGLWEDLENGGQYAGVNTANMTVSNLLLSNNGKKYRTISSSGVCVDTSDIALLTVTPTSGINKLSLTDKITIFPNPTASNMIYLEASAPVKIANISITDIEGSLLIDNVSFTSEDKIPIDISTLSSGIYLIKVTTSSNESGVLKFVKQ